MQKVVTSALQQMMSFSPAANGTSIPAVTAEDLINDGDDSAADDDEEDGEDIEVEVDDEEEGHEMAEGDEDVVKSSLRKLGLMGNVAYIGEETFKCPLCQIKLDSQHAFTLHIRSHNPNDHSNTCRLCGKTLSSASSLDRHMLIHSGERPFKCSLCGMAFTTNGNMHRHMRTHGHGQIGYTARGAKRRAKLLAQRAAKVAAAAAAGEPVDAATISKLKKTALEVSKSPQSFKRRFLDQSPQLQETLTTYSNMINSNVAVPASMEAAAAAAVAAAAAAAAAETSQAQQASKIKPGKNMNTHHKSSSRSTTHNPQMLSSFLGGNDLSGGDFNHAVNGNNNLFNLSQPNINVGGVNWSNNNNGKSAMPEKGKPGRKRKLRPYEMSTNAATAPSAIPNLGASESASLGMNNIGSPLFDLRLSGLNNSASNMTCPICNTSVRSKMDLHYHMATTHSSERLFCLDCGMISENYDIYTKHRCTASIGDVVSALQQNSSADPEQLFSSTNTNRLNFKSAKTISLNGTNATNNFGQQHQGASATSPTSINNSSAAAALQSLLYTAHPDFAALYRRPAAAGGGGPISSPPQSTLPFTQTCNQCAARFSSIKELKHHNETFCHECSKDCLTAKHYLAHTIASHQNSSAIGTTTPVTNTSQLGADNQAFLQAAVGAFLSNFPGFLNLPPAASMMKNNSNTSQLAAMLQQPQFPLGISSNQQGQVSSKVNRHSPAVSPNNNNCNKTTDSMLMADMKPDLADIQSIINMAKYKLPPALQQSAGAQSALQQQQFPSMFNQHQSIRSSLEVNLITNNNAGQQLRSPNRASDAGKFEKRGGDAQHHQPESPASADSAAGALSASMTHTDGNIEVKVEDEQEVATALCLTNRRKPTNNEDVKIKEEATLNEEEDDDVDEDEEDEDDDEKLLVVDDDEDDEEDEGEDLGVKDEEEEDDDQHFDGDDEMSPIKRRVFLELGINAKSAKQELNPAGATPPFRCESCRLSFKSSNAFRRHNRGHTATGGHSHSCPHCPYKSLDKSTLIRHQRTHNGERPFQCAICKYAFTTKANCERHVKKRHKQLKTEAEIAAAMQYNCNMAVTAAATRLVSEKIFIERDELPTSQDTVCRQCGQDFHVNRELRAHLRAPNNTCSQNLKPFICTLCKGAFNTRNNCVRHIIKRHPDTLSEIEMSDAVQQALIETGSCASSLSPNSVSGASSTDRGTKRSLHSSSSSSSSESESPYGAYDDNAGGDSIAPAAPFINTNNGRNVNKRKSSSPSHVSALISPSNSSSNASFAALCQMDQMNDETKGDNKTLPISSFSPLNLSKKENVKSSTKAPGDVVLDLSVKTKFDL